MIVRAQPSLRFIVSCALAAAAAVACTPVLNAVRIEAGPSPRVPRFVLTDTTGRIAGGLVYGLSVLRCGSDSAAWTIAATGSAGTPMRIVYGTTPSGYVAVAGPDSLRTGCYEVFITDGRRARFQLDRNGRVVVPLRAQRDSIRR